MGTVIVLGLLAGLGGAWAWLRRRDVSRPKTPLEERAQAELEVMNRARRRN